MRRSVALVGSIALHAGACIVLLALRSQDVEVARPADAPIQLVERDPAVLVVDIVELANAGGGGSSGTGVVPQKGSDLVTPLVVRHSDRNVSLADSLAGIATKSVDSSTGNRGDGGDGGGQGGGHGTGRGRGIGIGDGATITEQPRVATPAAPRASKARRAKLVYPSGDREVEDGKVFIARVTVDREGFVVGARLVQRMGGPRDDQAGSLIFRFRYSPALDDEGRPIRSTLDQQFLVGD